MADQVGAGVADDLHALGVLGGDDAQGRVVVDQVAGVDQAAVDLAGDGGLGQAGTDGLGDLQDGDGGIELALAAVGKGDGDHVGVFSVQQKIKAPKRLAERSGGSVCSAVGGGSAHVARSAGVAAGHPVCCRTGPVPVAMGRF